MNLQQVFDKAASHLLIQNARAQDEAGRAVYADQMGRKCPVGIFICGDIEKIASRSVGASLKSLRRNEHPEYLALATSGVPLIGPMYTDLLDALQGIHDREPVKAWPRLLRNTAGVFGLCPDVVDETLHLTGQLVDAKFSEEKTSPSTPAAKAAERENANV